MTHPFRNLESWVRVEFATEWHVGPHGILDLARTGFADLIFHRFWTETAQPPAAEIGSDIAYVVLGTIFS